MTKEESLAWAKLLQAQGEGKTLQHMWQNRWVDAWFNLDPIDLCTYSVSNWRIKPEEQNKVPVYRAMYDGSRQSITITSRETGFSIQISAGEYLFNVVLYTAWRNNSSTCTPQSKEMPWDVQQDILHLVYSKYTEE